MGVYACVALFDQEQGVARRLSYRGFRLIQAVFGSADVVGGVFQGRFGGFDGVQLSFDILAEKGWRLLGLRSFQFNFKGLAHIKPRGYWWRDSGNRLERIRINLVFSSEPAYCLE